MGIYAFRYLNFLYRIFFFQLIPPLLIFILGSVLNYIANIDNVRPNNQWLYNLYMPVETYFLAWSAYEYFKSKKRTILIFIGYVIFLGVFIAELFIKGISVFANHGYIAESALLLVIYLLILYNYFTNHNNNWKRSPIVWISIGIVLYFGGAVPYLSLMHFLQDNHPRLNLFLFQFIIEGLANVRYLLLALGFWLIRRNAKSNPSTIV